MKIKIYIIILFLPVLLAASCDKDPDQNVPPPPPPGNDLDLIIQTYMSTPDEVNQFTLQDESITKPVSDEDLSTIAIDTASIFQDIDGFGYTLNGGSAKLLSAMSASSRANLLNELFDHKSTNIGVSYLRLSIGSSDLDEYTFSYNSTVDDVDMENFDLGYDKNYLIPILKEILKINPDIKILGSPWSPPVWMKTNNNTVGGSLQTNYYAAYAKYFVKYIEHMALEGITIDAITIQNEPLHDGNNPSMKMLATEQASFIKNHLGPLFEANGINTKIILYDHNADKPDYPISILNDADVKKYVDGSAFHLYAGDISALSSVHSAHPDKALYFTEQWVGAPGDFANDLRWHMREVIIGSTRNWSRIALEWNLAADENLQPHTPGGCTSCLGALTINGNNIVRNPAFYIIAHAAKFVRPGSHRIQSNVTDNLHNVAFYTPDNEIVLLVLNDSGMSKSFNVSINNKAFTTTLVDGAVGTYVIQHK